MTIADTPPSTQHIYAPSKHGRLYFKDGYLKLWWRNEIKRQWKEKIITTPLSVIIEFTFPDKRKRDLDNFNKIILDVCSGIVWVDDSQIEELILRKTVGKKPQTTIIIG